MQVHQVQRELHFSRRSSLFSILFLWISLVSLWAQSSIKLTGKIVDEHHSPLSYATVKLLKTSGQMQTGASTDANGHYELKSVPTGSYRLEVSFVGYATASHSITVAASPSTQSLPTITLSSDEKHLKEVSVVAKVSEVVVKGDTLEYNAGSYTTAQGAVLDDLLKKLPGAEVDSEGNITVNGKTVTKIMVDGKRFFENDPKIAVKNIPVDMVEKVQVLDRDSEASRLSGFSDGEEETVINLTIKPGRKKGLFGTAYAGAGTNKRYEANAIVNRFADDKQWTLLTGLNNTNNAGFSDISQDLSQAGFLGSLSGQNRPGPRNAQSNGGVLTSRVLGGNLVLPLSTLLSSGGNAFYGNTDKTLNTRSYVQNILPSGSTTEEGTSSERNKKNATGAALRLEWKPDSKTELIFSPNFRYGRGRGWLSSEGTTINDTDGSLINSSSSSQETDSKTWETNLKLDASRKLGNNGRTLTLGLETKFSGEDTDANYLSILQQTTTNTLDLYLDGKERTQNYRARLGWVEPLGKGYWMQLSYQIRAEKTSALRDAYEPDASGSYAAYTASYSRDFHSTFLSHRIGMALKKKGDKYDITAGINLDPSYLSSQTISAGITYPTVRQHTLNYSPTLRLSYKPQKGTDLRIDYRGRSFQPTASQLSPVEDPTNPLVRYEGNPLLKPGYRHDIFARFGKFWSQSQSSLNLFTNLQYVQNDIVSASTYDLLTGIRTTSYTNVSGNSRFFVGGFYNTPVPGTNKTLSLRIGAFNGLSQQIGVIDGLRNKARSINTKANLSLTYRKSILDTSIKGTWEITSVHNSLSTLSSGSTIREYSLGWDNNLNLPLNITVEGSAEYSATSGYASGFNQKQWLINLGLSYSFLRDKQATLRLKVYDLLGQNRDNVYRSITAQQIVSQEVNTLGRYAMLHLIYRFNSFSGGASSSDMKRQGGPGSPGGPPPHL